MQGRGRGKKIHKKIHTAMRSAVIRIECDIGFITIEVEPLKGKGRRYQITTRSPKENVIINGN